MNIQLRTGVASDATAIHNLITANLNAGHLLPRTFDDVESHAHRFVVAVADGQVIGKFEATGIRPRFLEQVMAHGITLSADLFRPDAKFEA